MSATAATPPAGTKPITVVDSTATFAPSALLQLWDYRELTYALTVREVKARYRQTLLGFGWAVAQPLAFMVVFSLVFSRFARLPSDGSRANRENTRLKTTMNASGWATAQPKPNSVWR